MHPVLNSGKRRLLFYTTQAVGLKQSMTPEGYLLCESVPIARVGDQIYGPSEIPITPGNDGRIIVSRDADEVFADRTMLSIHGKPVTDEHPMEDVTAENWAFYTKGIVFHPRRGDGDAKDLLLADLLITNRDTIEAIRAGKREISCGYDADYDEIEPGRGRQRNIIVNHVALVEGGRCGPRCAIGDRRQEQNDMTRTCDKRTSMWDSVLDRIATAFKSKDTKAFDEALEEAKKEAAKDEEGMHGIHLHVGGAEHGAKDDEMPPWFKKHAEDCDKRFKDVNEKLESALKKWAGEEAKEGEHKDGKAKDAETEEEKKEREAKESKDAEEAAARAIEGALHMEAPAGTGDMAVKARDSVYLADSFQETVALAEILSPGIKPVPTFDTKAPPKTTYDAMCGLRRKSLEAAYADAKTKPIIDKVLGGKTMDLSRMSCDAVRPLFLASANLKKAANSGFEFGKGDIRQEGADGPQFSCRDALHRMNQQNAEVWANRT